MKAFIQKNKKAVIAFAIGTVITIGFLLYKKYKK